MTKDEVRNRLLFYQDLGVKTIYRRSPATSHLPPATSNQQPATSNQHNQPPLHPLHFHSGPS
jgi:hypothetical protein